MIFELILAGVGLMIFIGYNILFTYLNGDETPRSISETSYMAHVRWHTTLPFTALCVISAVFLFPLWIDKTPDEYQFLVFLSCAGMLFAGSTPLYRQEFESKVHYTGGAIAFVCGIAWLVLMHCWISLISIAVVGGLWTLIKPKSWTFIFEFVGYVCLHIAVYSLIE